MGYSRNSNPDGFRKRMHDTWVDDWKYFTTSDEMSSNTFEGTFKGLKLPRKVVDKIYCENAVRWYKLRV